MQPYHKYLETFYTILKEEISRILIQFFYMSDYSAMLGSQRTFSIKILQHIFCVKVIWSFFYRQEFIC